MTTTVEITFEPPGPGDWMLDTTHHGRRPTTRFMRSTYERAFDEGMTALFAKYGLPMDRARVGWVHGCAYVRIMAIGEPEKPKPPPPALLMKLISRLHPEMRRRTKTARSALAERRWRKDVDAWFGRDRARVAARNRALQGVELEGLDDPALLDHLRQALDHADECAVDSFRFHGGDIVPVGLFTAACAEWGISARDSASLLRGASPATMETDRLLAPVAAAIAAAGEPPSSVDAVRALGPEIAATVDEWLEDQGWRLLTSDDIDAPTLAERPDLQLRALLSAEPARDHPGDPDPATIRSRVPPGEQGRFDELLAEARYGMRLRDDQVGVRWNWPAGLIRRALLEVGRRLVERGSAHEAEHAIELDPDGVAAALAGEGPMADELAQRRAFRDAVEAASPPDHFASGVDAEPPFDALPAPMATMARGVFAVITAMESPDDRVPMFGAGIGDEVVRGRACVVRSHLDAFDAVEPGDVLIAPFTSPSYNSLFPQVAAVVTEEGGPLSHAAIMAREFGLSAVIGVLGATDVPPGSTVEVDPVAGELRVLS